MANISSMLLAECWRLETFFRPFYVFIKALIFNSWHLPILVVPYSPFQKDETLEFWLKIITFAYIYLSAKFGDSMGYGSKDVFKNGPCLVY